MIDSLFYSSLRSTASDADSLCALKIVKMGAASAGTAAVARCCSYGRERVLFAERGRGKGTTLDNTRLRYSPAFLLPLPKRNEPGPLTWMCYAEAREDGHKVLMSNKNEALTVEARSMEDIYDMLTEHLIQTVDTASVHGSKYIIGLAGPPGSGKSTVASEVIGRLNVQWNQQLMKTGSLLSCDDVGIVVPMDGFHLYRSQLDKMENPEEAHARRGAPWTFDSARLLDCLQTLRRQGAVSVPSFDHGVGDPVENDIVVSQHHKVVIVEGNYLFLDEDIWKEISSIFDVKWFIEVDIDAAMHRVLKRHISTGKASDIAKWRIEYNDRPNAELIMKSKTKADFLIRSVDRKSS